MVRCSFGVTDGFSDKLFILLGLRGRWFLLMFWLLFVLPFAWFTPVLPFTGSRGTPSL